MSGPTSIDEAVANMKALVEMSDAGADLGSQGGPWLGEIEDMRQTIESYEGSDHGK